MTIPPWIIEVLDAELPDLVGAARDRLAERIIERLPRRAIAKAIATSAQAVLETRNIRDGAGDLARELGANAAQAVCFTLEGLVP